MFRLLAPFLSNGLLAVVDFVPVVKLVAVELFESVVPAVRLIWD